MLETWPRERRVRLPTIVMLETWLRESWVLRQMFLLSSGNLYFGQTFSMSSANLYRIVTLPFSILTTPWWYIGVHPPVMLETRLRESRVRPPTEVVLETWNFVFVH